MVSHDVFQLLQSTKGAQGVQINQTFGRLCGARRAFGHMRLRQ